MRPTARGSTSAGESWTGIKPADLIQSMADEGETITKTIKQLHYVFRLPLSEAKDLVGSHQAWKPIAEAAEPLHRELVAALNEDDQ